MYKYKPLVLPVGVTLLLLISLVACGGETATGGSTTLAGVIGVTPKQVSAVTLQARQFLPTVELLNQHMVSPESHETGATLPVRGLNATVLSQVLSGQSADPKPLFTLDGQMVIAVAPDGQVLGSAAIQADGSWQLTIQNKLWKNVGSIGLFQGYASNDGFVCEKPLNYEDDGAQKTAAVFSYPQLKTALQPQSLISLGHFNFHPDSGNPTSLKSASSLEPSSEAFDASCNGTSIITVQVTADFNWRTPANLPEERIYETGVGFAIDTRDEGNPAYVNVAPLSSEGLMNMLIHKPEGMVVPLALVMSDTELIKLTSVENLSQIKMPLTPTFDLNAAIRYGNPNEPAQVPVGDAGYAYDSAQTSGGMALLSGQVTLSNGQAASNALVIGVIDSAEVIAFNLAISQPDGRYELLLPATDDNLPYYIIAISADEREVGKPINVPRFKGDAAELRYAITSARAYAGADIRLQRVQGDDTAQTGTISGTVSVPAGANVRDVNVAACTLDYSNCLASVRVQANGREAAYRLENVPAGQYFIIARKGQDTSGPAALQGTYSLDGVNPTSVSPPATGININLVDLQTSPPKTEVTILRPADFVAGEARISIENLDRTESLAVIPVYASQTLSPDAFELSIEVSGLAALNLDDFMPADITEAEPETDMMLQFMENHLDFLSKSEDFLNQIQQDGIKPLAHDGLQTQAFDKCPAPYAVSKVCQFWIWTNDGFVSINASLGHISPNAYWFVQNEDLNDLPSADLASLARDFEEITIPTIRGYFGDFADVDNNGKIIIVFSRLVGQDGLLGYVPIQDLFPDEEVIQYGVRSNEGDIFYAATPNSLGGLPREAYMRQTMPSTITHELKHLVAVAQRILSGKMPEQLWLEEPSAVAASELAGQGSQMNEIQGVARFGLANPAAYRIVYDGRPENPQEDFSMYGYNFLLLWRIAEQVGHESFWRNLMMQPSVGIRNLELAGGKPMHELMLDWAPSLLFDNTFLVDGYEYESLNLRDGSWTKLNYQPLRSTTARVRSMAYYVARGNGETVNLNVRTSHPDPYVIVVRFKGALP